MRTGATISAIGHLALILVLLFGGLLSSADAPLPDAVDVAVISAEEFAALASRPEPELSQDVAAPVQPTTEAAPEMSPRPEAAPESPRPRAAETPDAPDPVPDQPALDTPQAEVSDAPPDTLPQPELEAGTPDPLPGADPAPRPVPRVAPVPAPAPPETAETAPDTAPPTAPDPVAETTADDRPEAAPAEAAPEIVTEAETPAAGAPTRSPRPRTRPPRPVATADETPPDAEPPQEPAADPVTAALTEALTAEPPAPSGPPLTSGERDALRVAVEGCWNVGSLSSDALATTVVVAVSMLRDGRPDIATIRLLSSDGGSQDASRQAFEAARRAIIRCGVHGYPLPAEKYERWRDIEMTFNPESMRIR